MNNQFAKPYYEQYWRDGLAGWSPIGISITALEQDLLSRFLRPTARVLDFGCGDGAHASSFVLSKQCRYSGVDVSEHAVAMCRAKGLGALTCSPDAALPFDSASFDNVLSFEVLEHLFEPAAALREIHRVLQPQGRLIGSVPNSVFFANRLLMVSGSFSPGGSPATSLRAPWKDPHIRFFNKRALLRLLNVAGFTHCRVLGAEFSLIDFPVLYKSAGAARRLIQTGSRPLGWLGKSWPSLWSAKLYFVAQKGSADDDVPCGRESDAQGSPG
jgi:SAM-dependent methyltransferase